MTKIKPDRLEVWTIYILKTYNYFREGTNQAETVEDIPHIDIVFLSAFTYLELITPFVCKDLKKGMSRDKLEIKYRVTESEARHIGRKLGFYKKLTTK